MNTRNRLTTVGVLFVTLLLPTAAQSQTRWTITTEKDKLTDAQVLTTVARATTDNGNIYELTLKCDAVGKRENTVSTFTARGEGRAILWTTLVADGPTHTENLGRREYIPQSADHTAAIQLGGSGVLQGTHTRIRMDSGEVVDGPFIPKDFSNVGAFGALNVLPTTRLLIADLFPDETVEFQFSALSAAQRAVLTRMCIDLPAQKAQEQTKHDAEAKQQREAAQATAKAQEKAAALERWCGSAQSRVFPSGAERFQVQVGDKWVSFKDVWTQVQCAREEAVRQVLGPPVQVKSAPEVRLGDGPWLYNVNASSVAWRARMGNVLRGYQFGGISAYVINGVVVFQ
jgi:hypothetical protein